jgi:hypothetical protein
VSQTSTGTPDVAMSSVPSTLYPPRLTLLPGWRNQTNLVWEPNGTSHSQRQPTPNPHTSPVGSCSEDTLKLKPPREKARAQVDAGSAGRGTRWEFMKGPGERDKCATAPTAKVTVERMARMVQSCSETAAAYLSPVDGCVRFAQARFLTADCPLTSFDLFVTADMRTVLVGAVALVALAATALPMALACSCGLPSRASSPHTTQHHPANNSRGIGAPMHLDASAYLLKVCVCTGGDRSCRHGRPAGRHPREVSLGPHQPVTDAGGWGVTPIVGHWGALNQPPPAPVSSQRYP